MTDATRTVVVAGDVTVDWMLLSTEGVARTIELSRAWGAGFACRAVSQAGGACLLGRLVAETVAADEGRRGRLAVAGPALPEESLTRPGYHGLTQAYTSWAPYPATTASRDVAWRVQAFLGEDPAIGGPLDFNPEGAEGVDCLVIDDSAMGFRDRPELWPAALRTVRPALVVLKMASPLAAGALWGHLVEQDADRLTVVVSVSDLRKDSLQVGYPLSWEQMYQDVEEAVSGHTLAQARRVVVTLGSSGAVIVERDGETTLVFDPTTQEGDWERAYPGHMVGYATCATAGVLLGALDGDTHEAVLDGVARGLQAARTLHAAGYEQVGEGADLSLRFPSAAVAAALLAEPASFSRAALPFGRCGFDCSILVDSLGDRNLEELALSAAVEGPERLPSGIPVETVGAWSSVDRVEIESIRSVRAILDEYIERYRSGIRVERPLSLAVFGPPGSGKSFAVKQIAGVLLPGQLKTLEFNLSQFASEQELPAVFHQIRDVVLEQYLPLVFWDEFDASLGGRPLGWLTQFLAPMQDGMFREQGIFRPIGPAIFVFAGGTRASLSEFVAGADEGAGKDAKKPDFLSRLRGYVNVLGPNRLDAGDLGYVLRRAMLLRALVKRKAPQMIRGGHLNIDDGVLAAFIGAGRFYHGARSMEAIIDMSSLAGKMRFERSSLPPRRQLTLHVDADEFLRLVAGQGAPFRGRGAGERVVSEGTWLRVGVTGHRALHDEPRLRAEVRAALERARAGAARPPAPAPAIEIVSPLAEGADRVVVHEVLKDRSARLVVPLPFAAAEYVRDFATEESRTEFEELLARADRVVVMPPTGSRADSYAAAGRYVVEHCDVLLALWDGRPTQGPGGTAEIVAHAQEQGKAVVWIETKRGGRPAGRDETSVAGADNSAPVRDA